MVVIDLKNGIKSCDLAKKYNVGHWVIGFIKRKEGKQVYVE